MTTTSPSPLSCVQEGFTAETNNLSPASTPVLGSAPSPTMATRQTNGTTGTANCAVASVADGAGPLQAGQVLPAGDYLLSPGGQYTLDMQTDGNLVVYGNGCVIWASGTEGTGSGDYLAMQADGNLVVDTGAGQAVWAAGRANAGELCTGADLHAGEYLYSPDEQYELSMQNDGNLVVYKGSTAVESLSTEGTGTGNYLAMQSDGNLVLYTDANAALWSSGTQGTGSGNYLLMQDDGNLVVYTSGGTAVWALQGH